MAKNFFLWIWKGLVSVVEAQRESDALTEKFFYSVSEWFDRLIDGKQGGKRTKK
jgi:hypothetical protein